MIKAIIFDCFGVLAEDGWLPIKRKYVGDNKKLAEELADLGKQNEYGMVDNESYVVKMADLMGINSDELRTAMGRRVPNEELFEFIEKELKPKYKIGLMTNANYNVLKDLFEPGQGEVFDSSVMSFESRLIKPDKRMYDLIADRLGVESNECVYVDDQERYCFAAEDYGMQAIFYKDFEQFKERLRKVL